MFSTFLLPNAKIGFLYWNVQEIMAYHISLLEKVEDFFDEYNFRSQRPRI